MRPILKYACQDFSKFKIRNGAGTVSYLPIV